MAIQKKKCKEGNCEKRRKQQGEFKGARGKDEAKQAASRQSGKKKV